MDIAHEPERSAERSRWRGPAIADIARAAGVGTATVDRVLSGRSPVREATRAKVLAALDRMSASPGAGLPHRTVRVAFLTESGASFNQSLRDAVARYAASESGVECAFAGTPTAAVDPGGFARELEQAAGRADALVVVAREDFAINRAVRAVASRGVPVVCLTTDLPTSGRTAYVGNDQTGAGAVAGGLMGRMLGGSAGRILLVISAPYRSQEERELGFRRVLRADHPELEVQERLNSNDDTERSHRSLARYLQEHGPPLGIYNVAGGNIGIARALRDAGLQGTVRFVGHELNANSRMLLESGGMDFVIGHDLDREVELCIAAARAQLRGQPAPPTMTPVRIYTKYNTD